MIQVAVDCMSGDNDPQAAVWGALDALLQEPSLHVSLVGLEKTIASQVSTWEADRKSQIHGWKERYSIVPASQVVTMEEHPANAVRAKKDASVTVACRLIAEGKAQSAVSAGNSGATLAAALLATKRIPGVHRPAIGGLFPSAKGSTFILDIGANTDCKPEWLLQFGVMGAIYARKMMSIAEPRVGLLSNGEESEKGSQLVQAAHKLMSESSFKFAGNVEGRDLFGDKCDVAVTDGFTGNVALKTAEGVGEFLFSTISKTARASLTGKIGGLLLKPKLRPLKDRVDYRKTGGALLLGVAGEVVIAHGRSDAEAMRNAVLVGYRAAKQDVAGQIAKEISKTPHAAAEISDSDKLETVSAGADS